MARKHQQQQPPAQPISLSQARQRHRPGKPTATPAPQSAADKLADRAFLKERAELVGRLDPYHAYRSGYGQGAWVVLSTLEILVNGGMALDATLYELRDWLMGPDFWEWINMPGDPTEIDLGRWLDRRDDGSSSSPASPPPSA